MHRASRLLLAAGLIVALLGSIAAVILMLVPVGPPPEIAVARVDSVTDTPRLLQVPELSDLSAIARQRRGSWGSSQAGSAQFDPRGIYLARDEAGAIRAFLAADPRNGCALEWLEWYGWKYHDVCHGSLYDRNGTPVGGPAPWTLDEAVIRIQHGVIFARTREVRPGLWMADERSALVPGCDIKANVRSVGAEWTFAIAPLRAGREEFIGHVYRGPFALQAHPGVRFGGRGASPPPSSIADVLAVGDNVCLTFRKGVEGADPIAFSDYVLTDLSLER